MVQGLSIWQFDKEKERHSKWASRMQSLSM